jgi:hypothetical protein
VSGPGPIQSKLLTLPSHLKPGAWMEQFEISILLISDDGSVKPDSTMARFGQVRKPLVVLFIASVG